MIETAADIWNTSCIRLMKLSAKNVHRFAVYFYLKRKLFHMELHLKDDKWRFIFDFHLDYNNRFGTKYIFRDT